MEQINHNNTHTYTTTITLEECQAIQQRVLEENKKNGKHMLEKSAEELFIQAEEFWCCIVKHWNELIWCVFLMGVEKWWITLYEWGSLFVKPWYRKQWIGQTLIEYMLKAHPTLPLYSVTNVLAVKKSNEELGQHKYTKEMIAKEILEMLESPVALLDNDVVYCNEILHTLLQKNA